MNEFKRYHPIANFIYFAFVIAFSCFFMHPICLGISIVSGFLYQVILKGKKAVKTYLLFMLPMLLFMAIINPLFNHQGVTIIGYLPNGNPMTMESLIYGFSAGAMIVSIICWFSCYNEVMTSDKFIYLFGKIMPSISLVISMTLRFVPRFTKQLKTVVTARKCMGADVYRGTALNRIKQGLSILSVMTTWSLENAIETADSMKARGYGTAKRTAFFVYTFSKRDMLAILWILVLGAFVLWGGLTGNMYFSYFPLIKSGEFNIAGISTFLAYLMLSLTPVIIEIKEVIRWKILKSKI